MLLAFCKECCDLLRAACATCPWICTALPNLPAQGVVQWRLFGFCCMAELQAGISSWRQDLPRRCRPRLHFAGKQRRNQNVIVLMLEYLMLPEAMMGF